MLQPLQVLQAVLSQVYTVLAFLGLVAVLVLLGLPEVPAFARKIRAGMEPSYVRIWVMAVWERRRIEAGDEPARTSRRSDTPR